MDEYLLKLYNQFCEAKDLYCDDKNFDSKKLDNEFISWIQENRKVINEYADYLKKFQGHLIDGIEFGKGYYDSFRTLSSKSIDQDSLELVSMYASTINEKYKNKEIIGKSIYDGHNFSRIDDGKILIMHNPYNLDDLSSLAKFHRNDVIIGFYGKKDDKNFSKRMDQMEQIRHHLGRDYTLCTDINNDNYFITMILNSQLEPKESQISEIPSWYYNYDNRHRTLKKIYHHNSDFSLNL